VVPRLAWASWRWMMSRPPTAVRCEHLEMLKRDASFHLKREALRRCRPNQLDLPWQSH